MQITTLNDDRRPVFVVSHERSGTHFTMNSIAQAFGYVSKPWFDVDRHQLNINYYAPEALRAALMGQAASRIANILKSHHEVAFLDELLDELAEAFHLVYVYRHPADCLASYWRLLNTLPWMEGPRCASALEFATTPPMGRLMRYQYHQYGTMLERWANHVRGWLDAAERRPEVKLVRYEDLAGDYAGTMTRLGARLGLAPRGLAPPSRSENVIARGPVTFEPAPGADNRTMIEQLALRTHPELMARLGYGPRLARTG